MIYNKHNPSYYNDIVDLYRNEYVNNKSGFVLKKQGIKGYLNQYTGVDEEGNEILNTFHFTTGIDYNDYKESDYLIHDGIRYNIEKIIIKKGKIIEYIRLILKRK